MKKMTINKLFSVSVLALAITGCASDGVVSEDAATIDESQTQAVAASPAVDMVNNEDAQVSNPLLDQTTIYFGYDRAEILPEFKDVLNAHAKFLVANPQSSIVFEGHCDERGTIEYNLALGERRANTVKSYLIVQGVNPGQLNSVSFGEERPALFGSDETTWSKNRRAEIRYSSAQGQQQIGNNL
ncbi:MAG: peptidoglycan-associated lipoprotein Pal [Bermanella sp.]